MKYRILFTFIFSFLLGIMTQASAQFTPSDERSSFEERRKSILDANRLRASYHNYGFAGRTSEDNRDELFFEFPKNTNRRYIFFASVFMGAEVTDQNSGNPIQIVDAPNFRTNPQTGDSWSINPVFGYFNENSEEVARSDRGPGSSAGNTWPEFWPDKLNDPNDPGWRDQWNGFFGKDIFNADQEFFYRAGDDLYTRFSQDGRWLPDPDDPSRGGLGLILDSRILAWTQDLISSVHFNIYEIRNDSRFDYNKVSFMLWTADWVGTPSNDRPFFDQERAVAFYTDTRPTSSPPEFDNTNIGAAGISFLETPGNAVDGIDNDGDSDFYFPQTTTGLYNPINADLFTFLTTQSDGFFNLTNAEIGQQIVPQFTEEDFQSRNLSPGDPIVLIDENGNRTLLRYPPNEVFGDENSMTLSTLGQEFEILRGGMTVREDTLAARHFNLVDDDLDGLIDENQPSHLTLTRIVDGQPLTRPVRFINYRWDGFFNGHRNFPSVGVWVQNEDGEWDIETLTIQSGLVVPDEWIEQRMETDDSFTEIVENKQENLKELYSRQPSQPIFPEERFDRYFRNIFTSAPMIDESREDFFDNNQDWEVVDDVGIDGVEGSGSRGEGDGFASSGAFTPFPGEPNIDATDVQETDAIGITSATTRNAGALGGGRSFRVDSDIWSRNMVPGLFEDVTISQAESNDLDQFITSGFFPLNSGSTERFAVAVSIGQTGTPTNDADVNLVTRQLENAFRAFDANYQFAIAPPPPPLTVIPDDKRVTLYWEDEAEDVFDRFLERIGENPENFEGYRVYRSTDAALADSRVVTDGQGNLQFLKPIAQFDLNNGISGNHPIDINGVEFFLGNDTGLRRSFVDTDIVNGRPYFYVVTAYNSGAIGAGIAPAESPINLSVNPDGSITSGPNVARVLPTGRSAGYVGPAPLSINRVSGSATGSVFADIIDPNKLKPDTEYRINFTSETVMIDGEEVNKTKDFSVTNVTENEVVSDGRTDLNGEDFVVDGVKITVLNDSISANKSSNKLTESPWAGSNQATIKATRANGGQCDYIIRFHTSNEPLVQTSPATIHKGDHREQIESKQVGFNIFDAKTGKPISFAYVPSKKVANEGIDRTGGFASYYDEGSQKTYSDLILILDENAGEMNNIAWQLHLEPYQPNSVFEVQPGTEIKLKNSSEFTEEDVFTFFIDSSIHIPTEDPAVAADNLDNIRVVPNPYIGTNVSEPRPTIANPTQLRQLHFTNLPAKCTIRIFTVSGRLVQTLNVNNSIDNDRFVWDMLTKDNLELSYGVYIYHVKAPGVGEKTGKFAVIK